MKAGVIIFYWVSHYHPTLSANFLSYLLAQPQLPVRKPWVLLANKRLMDENEVPSADLAPETAPEETPTPSEDRDEDTPAESPAPSEETPSTPTDSSDAPAAAAPKEGEDGWVGAHTVGRE